MSSIFGGNSSSQSSSSQNVNNGLLTSALSPALSSVGQATGLLSNILGGGFNNYKNQAGMNWTTEQGMEGITDNAAARGLLNSGATGKAIANYGNNQANTYMNSYLQNILGMGQLGTAAGGVLSSSGNVSNSSGSSNSKNGLGGLIGGAASRTAAGF